MLELGWNFACPDWEERLREGRSLVPDLPLDAKEAARSIEIFDRLRLPDVPGQPSMAEAAGDWFRDIVGSVFGSIDSSGRRRVREVFGLVPKKNSKTTGGAAMMITALLMNERPRAEFLLVGPTQDVADTAYQQAVGMIEADPEGYLQDRFDPKEHLKTINDLLNGAKLRIKTFDMRVLTGSKPVGILIDELHIMSQYSYASRVVGQMRGGLLANREGFLLIITTQSDQPPAGVFRTELQYARRVRDGLVRDSRMLPILYEFPEKMQTAADAPWRDPANWPMVTPNLGLSIDLETLIADYRDAKDKGADEERRWASQHLNVEIGLAMHADRWRGADYWLAAIEPGLTLDAILARAEVVTIGIDGGGLDDLLGLAVLGRCRITGKWLLWTKAWCDKGVLENRKEIAERLGDFEKDGDLVIYQAEDGQLDLTEVQEIVERIDDMGLLPEEGAIGLDTLGMPRLASALRSIGIEFPKAAQVGQGVKMNGVILDMERKLKERGLLHCGQAAAAWCVGNAKAELTGSAVKITKQAAGTAKIDILIAAFNAYSMMSLDPKPAGKSVYQKRGFLTI